MAKRSTARPDRGRPSSHELGVRFVAQVCLWLIAIVSTAQAVHVHGNGLPSRQAIAAQHEAGALASDDSVCPLCVAMHSAMPASLSYSAAPVTRPASALAAASFSFAAEPDHFAGFSRPPPTAVVLQVRA